MVNMFELAFQKKQAAIKAKAEGKTIRSVSVPANSRPIPEEKFKNVADLAFEIAKERLESEEKARAQKCPENRRDEILEFYAIPLMIIDLSREGFSKAEIAAKLSFQPSSDEFKVHWANARNQMKQEIVDQMFAPPAEMVAADPELWGKIRDGIVKTVFSRERKHKFSISVTHGVKETIDLMKDHCGNDAAKWHDTCDTAEAKLRGVFTSMSNTAISRRSLW